MLVRSKSAYSNIGLLEISGDSNYLLMVGYTAVWQLTESSTTKPMQFTLRVQLLM